MACHKIGESDTSGRFNVGLHKTMDGEKRQPNGCLAEGKKEEPGATLHLQHFDGGNSDD